MLMKYKEGLGKKYIYPRNFVLIQSTASKPLYGWGQKKKKQN